MKNNANQNQPVITPPLDYLVMGHVTADLTPDGIRMGGTVTFSGLTAHQLGLKTGIITSFSDEIDPTPIQSIWVKNKLSAQTTTFKNISDGIDRTQFLYSTAQPLTEKDLPSLPYTPSIVHLGPVANEVDPEILKHFPNSLKCLTPQGYFRKKESDNRIIHQPWHDWEKYLEQADVAVISQEDVQHDEAYISSMARSIPVFVVTENYKGARVYWHNDARFISAPEVKYVDDTGAGDIFAAAFFYRYFFTKDPWEAGRFAVLLASWSVQRDYLDSIPTLTEIEMAKLELLG